MSLINVESKRIWYAKYLVEKFHPTYRTDLPLPPELILICIGFNIDFDTYSFDKWIQIYITLDAEISCEELWNVDNNVLIQRQLFESANIDNRLALNEEWYPSGQLRHKVYSSNWSYKWNENGVLNFRKRNTIIEEWYDDGVQSFKKHTVFYDLCSGASIIKTVEKYWYENGKIMSIQNYRNGKLHGLYQGWDREGNITYKHRYNNGNRVMVRKCITM